jgi:hypothetical protein
MPGDPCASVRRDQDDPAAPTEQGEEGRSSTIGWLAKAAGTLAWPGSRFATAVDHGPSLV